MYLLFDEDSTVTKVDELPEYISWNCWPKVIQIKIYHGLIRVKLLELTEDGWKEI